MPLISAWIGPIGLIGPYIKIAWPHHNDVSIQRIGKMRRTTLAGKRLGEMVALGKQDSRCLPCKFVEITNQVSLIIISTLKRNCCPRVICAFDCSKHLLKSQDSTQKLWAKPNPLKKSSFKLPATDSSILRQLVH